MKTVRGRLLAMALGILAPLVVCEVALRVWARLEGRRLAETVAAIDPLRRPIVVFCGDSHVYGVYVEAHETLPAALARLTQAGGAPGIRAINLGVPGHATWDVLEQVKRAAAVKPAAIVVSCGSNNYTLKPPGEGLGILESSKLVKLVRRTIANIKFRSAYGELSPLHLGPDGKKIPGGSMHTVGGTEAVMVTDREGLTQIQFRRSDAFTQEAAAVESRMRADFAAMAAEARRASCPIVFATYLAGEGAGFAPVTRCLREAAASDGAVLADCSRALTPAISWNVVAATESGAAAGASSAPPHVLQNNLAAVLVKDLHPTALGYEIEARVVARAFADAGIFRAPVLEDPIAPVRAAAIVKPTLAQSAERPEEFEIRTAPGDRVVVFVGAAGSSEWNGTPIPLDRTAADAVRAKYGLREFDVVAGPDGKATIVVVRQCLQELTPPVLCVALAERGGRQGSARRFLTPTLVVNVPR